jgi:nucleoside-diphosphate-sugar epimerase
MKRNTTIEVLLLGGKGTIGSGLRKFLPQLDSRYKFTIVDFNDSDEKLENIDPKETFIHFDISNDSEKLKQTLLNKDLIIYLARKDPLNKMNEMTDLVFSSIQEVCSKALVIGSSSVHATGGAYFPFSKKPYSIIAKREFNQIIDWPKPLSAYLEPCPTGDYGLEKAYVESWCQRFAATNKLAIAARWGGINVENVMIDEVAYFTVWCHQEDSARFVDSCYKTFLNGNIRSGAHYYVISNNTYSIFDIETPKKELGYIPKYDAEIFYRK